LKNKLVFKHGDWGSVKVNRELVFLLVCPPRQAEVQFNALFEEISSLARVLNKPNNYIQRRDARRRGERVKEKKGKRRLTSRFTFIP
jgi:predicted amidophosphoribosyltransferase